jgi:Tol biopolymer transport system component
MAYDRTRSLSEGDVYELYVAAADGSSPLRLTTYTAPEVNCDGADTTPSWSADGERLVFDSLRLIGDFCGTKNLWLVDADGRNLHPLAGPPPDRCLGRYSPSWSSTGRIAFFWDRQVGVAPNDPGNPVCEANLYSVREDGGDLRQLTRYRKGGYFPADLEWSPNGEQIFYTYQAFRYVMSADGTGRKMIGGFLPESTTWSPDGKRVALIGPVRSRMAYWRRRGVPGFAIYSASLACAEALPLPPLTVLWRKYFKKPSGRCRSLRPLFYMGPFSAKNGGYEFGPMRWQPLR